MGRLGKLDNPTIADNVIVRYSTKNGSHMNTWPAGTMTLFRNEKNSNWEGAFRVSEMIRWPAKIEAGSVSNKAILHGWPPTFLGVAGNGNIVEEFKAGMGAGNDQLRSRIDGYNLTGEGHESPPSASVTTSIWWHPVSSTGKSFP